MAAEQTDRQSSSEQTARQSSPERPARQSPSARSGRPSPSERLTFALAAAVVLTHTLAAAFIALEPGVGRGVHAWGALLLSAALVVSFAPGPRRDCAATPPLASAGRS